MEQRWRQAGVNINGGLHTSTSSVSKEDELESGNHQLVVKSTFLDVMDGFSAPAELPAPRDHLT